MKTLSLALFAALFALPVLLHAQAPTAPTSCAVNDLTTWQSINFAPPGTSVNHASVLGHVDGASAGALPPYSLVNGFAMPGSGREIALLGAGNGLLIIDTHDMAGANPGTMVPTPWVHFALDTGGMGLCAALTDHRGAVAYPTANGALIVESNPWRPYLRVFQITESVAGLAVVSMPNIPLPIIAGPMASPRLAIDAETGLLYVPGVGAAHLHVYDLNQYLSAGGPQPPIWVWSGINGTGAPTFDVHIFRDGDKKRIAISDYSPGINSITIVDVTNLPASATWASWVPNEGTHSVWVDADAKRLYNSFGDAFAIAYDLTSFELDSNSVGNGPNFIYQPYRVAPTALNYGGAPWRFHSMEGVGLTGYAAGWESGLQVVDLLSDTINPNQSLVNVDTCLTANCGVPGCIGGYSGAWSVRASQESGVIYISDQARGLYLARAEVAHMNRYGTGLGSANHPAIPRLSLDYGPPRVSRPPTAANATFHAIPPLDYSFGVTVGNLQPPAIGPQFGVLDLALQGDVNSTSFFPGGVFPRYGKQVFFQVLFHADNPSVLVKLPLAGAFEGLPVFLQAAIYQDLGTGYEVVACSRGTFVGIAAKSQ